MHTTESLKWLESKGLSEISKEYSDSVENVFKKCLDIKKEVILIIGDTGFEEDKRISAVLSGAYYFAAKKLGLAANLILQEAKTEGDCADEDVVKALTDLRKGNILIINQSNRLGDLGKVIGQSYRVYAKEMKYKFTSALNLGKLTTDKIKEVISAINIDYEQLNETGTKLKKILDKGEEVHITTSAGTDLVINIEEKEFISNAGDYTLPGKGGNIPAGEVYAATRWKYVEGKAVIDGSSATIYGTNIIKTPIVLDIKKGEITDIKGGKEADALRKSLEWAHKESKYPWGVRRIGELGIGLNPNAKIIGATTVDEKKLGTCHIAIGSNYWFGGTIYAKIHLDQVIRNPTIYVDGKKIMDDGKLIIS